MKLSLFIAELQKIQEEIGPDALVVASSYDKGQDQWNQVEVQIDHWGKGPDGRVRVGD